MVYEDYIKQKEEASEKIKNIKTELKEAKKYKKKIKKNWKINKSDKSIIKEEKRKIHREKSIFINQPPHLTLLEEIGNAVTHGLGTIFAITATVLMLVYSNIIKEIIGAVIYGACMIILFTISCLYHSFKFGTKVKRVFRRFDYSSIYLLIGGTFAPILLIFLNNTLGLIVLITQWIVIAIGITFVCIFGPGRLKWLHFPLYFILGWLGGIFIIPSMIRDNMSFFWWILSGGIVYTLGMIPFCFGGKKNAHFIWHFFVVMGAILQWIGIFVYLFLK